MPARMSFIEFRTALESGALSWRRLGHYLEWDPDSAVPRLRVRPKALRDPVPVDYDVDNAVYRLQQERARVADKTARRSAARAQPRIVAEGDSWYMLPTIVPFPTAIADRIQQNGMFSVRNIARWGDTLDEIVRVKEYLRVLKAERGAAWFILSAGGNDIKNALAQDAFLLPYDSTRPLDQSISPAGHALLKAVTTGYRTILSEVRAAHPQLDILCYSYDYPRPETGDGTYIGKHLKRLGYPKKTWTALMKVMMEHIATAIMAAASAFPRVAFLDCFNDAQPYTWYDDMHPGNDGFKALAKHFEKRMMSPAIVRRVARRRNSIKRLKSARQRSSRMSRGKAK